MPHKIDDAQEHPIIFNDWSIQRILAGEKTQTRRIVNPQPDPDRELEIYPYYHDRPVLDGMKYDNRWEPYPEGGVLWVREAFRLAHTYDEMTPREYVDEFQPHIVRFEADEGDYNAVPKDGWGRKRPSTHMPRELSRLRLRVEDVRVEQVQEIYASDCAAEGISSEPSFETDNPIASATKTTMRERFREKWNDIYGDGAWERNDWVWVIKFSLYDE